MHAGVESWGPGNTVPSMFRQLITMLQSPTEFAGHAVETDIMAQLQASEEAFNRDAAARAKKH
eukprot:gene43646-7358_t